MLQFSSKHFIGKPTPHAHAEVVERADHFIVTFSLSGVQAQEMSKQIKEKLQHSQIDSPTSFLSLLERVQELWSGSYGEMAAIYAHEGKIYLICKNGEIWLQRGEKFGRVLYGSDELKIVEGKVQDKDNYLVLTQSASVAILPLVTSFTQHKIDFQMLLQETQMYIDQSGLSDRCALGVVEVVVTEEPTQTVIEGVAPAEVKKASSKIDTVKLKALAVKTVSLGKRAVPIFQAGIKKAIFLAKNATELRNVRFSREQRKKIAAVLLVSAVVILLLVGIFVWRSAQIRGGQAFLLPFQQRLFAIQQLSNTDSVAARDQVIVLQKEFESQRTIVAKNFFAKKTVAEFSTQLGTFVKEVSGKVELQTLPIFYDFRLVRPDFIASRADTDQNIGVFIDVEKQAAISLAMDTKQQTVLPIGQYPVLKDISFGEDQLFLLGDGVYKFPIDSKNAAEKVIEEGDSNRDGKFLRIFGEYVYVLNIEKRNLFRYTIPKETGETPQPIGWFQDKKDLDFPQLSSFAIDGNVWLGTNQGQILRYERGNPVPFTIQSLQEPFSSTVKIFTKESLDSIFVLEAGKNRVVRLSKDGVFLRQIQSPSLGAATDIIFSSTTGKAYALAGSLVYELAL